jgi:hypothetical protein
MSDLQSRESWERTAAQPFVPANIAGVSSHHVSAEYRVAAALEYIAAQLGEINAKLSKLTGDNQEKR